jgi:hypothetical protein
MSVDRRRHGKRQEPLSGCYEKQIPVNGRSWKLDAERRKNKNKNKNKGVVSSVRAKHDGRRHTIQQPVCFLSAVKVGRGCWVKRRDGSRGIEQKKESQPGRRTERRDEERREEKRRGEERRSRIDAIVTCWDGLWTEGRRGEAREDETSEQREHS